MSEPVPFTLETAAGPLAGLVDLPELPGKRPAVVLAADGEDLEWAFLPPLAELLAARGFVAVRVGLGVDLPAVLAATGRTIAAERVDPARLGLFGHGRGGTAAILAAARPAPPELLGRLRALVTWAAGPEALAALPATTGVTVPWLLVEAGVEESVPVAAAGRDLLRIPGADPAFGARHPFAGPTRELIQALNATQRWFRRHLS